jgi:hypothetical protein
MPELRDGQYYDAVIVPEKCGFFRRKKNDGTQGALYLRLQLRCDDGQEYPYPYYVSGKMVERLRDDLPKMGVPPEALQKRSFYENAAAYIQPVECQFGIGAEEYMGEVKLKIKGVYFNGPKAVEGSDVDKLMSLLGGTAAADPFAVTDDDVPF